MSLVPEPLTGSPFRPEGRASSMSSDAKQAEKAAKDAANKAYLETFTRGDEHDKSVFVREQSTGVRVDERGRRQEGLDSEKVKITENLKTQYKVFLKNLFNSLTELRKDPQTGLLNPDFNTTALAGTSRMHEKHLYFLLTDKAGKLDEAKVEEYLKDPDHVMLVEEILEDHMRLRMFGMGLAALADPRGSRNGVYEANGTIRMDVDQGVINKAFEDYVLPWLNANNMVGNRADNSPHWWKKRFVKMIGGAAVAGVVAGPVGLVAGAAMGAAAGAGMIGAELFLANLFKRGVHVDSKWCVEALASIKGDGAGIPPNKSEAEYLRAVVGVDVDDFDVDLSTGTLKHKGTKTINREKILGETMGMMYTRTQYHNEIGVDVKDVDAMLEQGILETGPKDSVLALEQTRTRSQARIVELYLANKGSFDPYPTTQPARAQEVTRRLRILADARVKYMNELILRDVQKEKLAREVADEAKASSDIADKIKSRTEDDGQLVVEEREKIEKQAADLRGQREIIQNEGALLEKHGDVRKDVVQKEKEINDFLAGLGIDVTTLDTAGFKKSTQAEIEQSAQEVLRQMLEEDKTAFFTLKIGEVAFGPDTVIHQAEKLKIDKAAEIQTQDDRIPTSEQGLADIENNKVTADEVYKAEYARYTGFDTLIKGWQDIAINAARSPKISATEVITIKDSLNIQIAEAEEKRDALKKALLEGDATTIPPTKSLLAQKNEALSAYTKAKKDHEGLLIAVASEKTKIEAKYKTKEEELEAHKEDIKSAAAELKQKIAVRDAAEKEAVKAEKTDTDIAKAIELSIDCGLQYSLLASFRDAGGGYIIKKSDLETLSLAELLKKVNSASAVVSGTPPVRSNPDAWPESQNDLPQRREQVLHAMIEARSKAIASGGAITNDHRRQAITEMTSDLDKKLLVLEGDKTKVADTFKAEVAQLKEAQALLKRQTEILGNNNFAMEFILSTAPGADFANTMSSNLDPAVSTQEKDVTPVTIYGVPYEFGNTEQAYFVLLDMVTGYMSKGSSVERGKEFDKWSKALPPNEMAKLVCDHLLRTPAVLNMSAVTTLLVSQVNNGQIGPENVINFITNASREKVRKARALK